MLKRRLLHETTKPAKPKLAGLLIMIERKICANRITDNAFFNAVANGVHAAGPLKAVFMTDKDGI